MRKILLLLTLLVSSAGIIHAAESVVTITPADMKASNSSTSYVTSAFEFTADGSTFKANQVNPTSGQMKVNATGASGFTLYNTSAIDNITKVEVTADASTLGTWHMATGSTAITAAVTTSTANAVQGSISGTIITFEPSQENASYFHINLTSKGSLTVKFTSIKIYYGEAGPKEPVDYECADFTNKTIEIGATYALNLGSSHPDVKFASSNDGVASIDASGIISANAVGTATITASWDAVDEAFNAGTATFDVEVVKPAPTVTDELVWTNFTTTSSTTYMSEPKTYTSPVTGITYSALFAPNKYFQIRTSGSNSGIVTTANPKGYVLKSVKLEYASGTGAVDFYGDDTAYSAPSDLYATTANGNKIKGTSIGSLSSDGTLEVTAGSFNFFGLRSNSGARYIDKITLVWELVENEPEDYTALNDLTVPALFPGETFQLPLGEKFPAEMIMLSNDESIVTVTDEGLLTAVAPGTTTISVEWDADDNFNAGSAEINVTVKQPLETASMSFLHHVVYGKLGVGVVGQAAYYNGDGIITYTSSDETILKVNPATGMITKADVLRTGEVTITATAPETDGFHAATASYTIIVQDPNEVNEFDSDQAMFIFNEEEAYGMFLFDTNNSYEGSGTNLKQLYEMDKTGVASVTSSPVTLSFAGEYRHWNGSNSDYHLRTYQASTMTFSVPEGYYITKITFNQNRGTYTPLVAPDSETQIGTVTYGSSNKLATWEALDNDGNDINVSSVSLRGEAAHSRIYTMTVVWKKNASEQEPAQLSFTTTLYNDLVGTDINVNAVNNPHSVPVAYSIDNLEEGTDYTITDNGENLAVNVNKTGVYTLRARSNATDEYLPGIAILRLNVFPTVDLVLNDGESFDLTEEGEIVLPEEGGSFTIEGNYPNTVRIWYSLNNEAEQLYDGTPVEFTDDATLTYHLEYAETDRYRYTTNHTICVTPPAPACDIAHGDVLPTNGTINFTSKEGTTILYRLTVTEPAANSAMRAAAATEGWTSTEGNTLAVETTGLAEGTRVSVVAKALHPNGRIESATVSRALTVGSGTVTGLDNIDAAAQNAPVEYFNLQGIRVANPESGLYIRRQGNTVEKVTLNN